MQVCPSTSSFPLFYSSNFYCSIHSIIQLCHSFNVCWNHPVISCWLGPAIFARPVSVHLVFHFCGWACIQHFYTDVVCLVVIGSFLQLLLCLISRSTCGFFSSHLLLCKLACLLSHPLNDDGFCSQSSKLGGLVHWSLWRHVRLSIVRVQYNVWLDGVE